MDVGSGKVSGQQQGIPLEKLEFWIYVSHLCVYLFENISGVLKD